MENVYSAALAESERGIPHLIATVIESQGHSPAKVGVKMLVRPDGSIVGTVGGGALEKLCIHRALELMQARRSEVKKYWLDDSAPPMETEPTHMVCGGKVALFFEFCGSKERVILFGGGHIGKALAYHLRPLGFNTTVFDDRSEIIDQFPVDAGVETRLLDMDRFPKEIPESAWVVIASYSHEMDYRILSRLLAAETVPRYIGVVASRKKRDLFFQRLTRELKVEPDFQRVYTPCGLNIGTREPHDIAVAIVAEILALLNSGGELKHLRDT